MDVAECLNDPSYRIRPNPQGWLFPMINLGVDSKIYLHCDEPSLEATADGSRQVFEVKSRGGDEKATRTKVKIPVINR